MGFSLTAGAAGSGLVHLARVPVHSPWGTYWWNESYLAHTLVAHGGLQLYLKEARSLLQRPTGHLLRAWKINRTLSFLNEEERSTKHGASEYPLISENHNRLTREFATLVCREVQLQASLTLKRCNGCLTFISWLNTPFPSLSLISLPSSPP